jgi:hypothetical protein
MRRASRVIVIAAGLAASVSCGDVVRQGRAPVILVIESLAGARGSNPSTFGNPLISDVITNVTSPAPCTSDSPCPTVFGDPGQVVLRIQPKDIGTPGAPTTPSATNAVTLYRYRVTYRRADGRNTPGVDVPFAFDGALTATVFYGAGTTVGFELVRNDAKVESPLVQLRTSGVIINSIADVTFYGRDQAGNDVTVTGSMYVDFGNFGD